MKAFISLYLILIISILILVGRTEQECPAGQYPSHNICEKCSEHCLICYDDSGCLICESGYGVLNQHCVTECPEGYYAVVKTESSYCTKATFEPLSFTWKQKDEDINENFIAFKLERDISQLSFCFWYQALEDQYEIELLTWTTYNKFSPRYIGEGIFLGLKAYRTEEPNLLIGLNPYSITGDGIVPQKWKKNCISIDSESITSYYLDNDFYNLRREDLKPKLEKLLPKGDMFLQVGPRYGKGKINLKSLVIVNGKLLGKDSLWDGYETILHYYLYSKKINDLVTRKSFPLENGLTILEDKKGIHFERHSFYTINIDHDQDITIEFSIHLQAFPFQMIDLCQLYQIKAGEFNVYRSILKYDDSKWEVFFKSYFYSASTGDQKLYDFTTNVHRIISIRSKNLYIDNQKLPLLNNGQVTLLFGAEYNTESCNFYLSNLMISKGSPAFYSRPGEKCSRRDISTDQCLECKNSILNFENNTCEGQCPPNCISCFHEDVCEECQEGFFLKEGYCTKECTRNQVAVANQCLSIHPHCIIYDKMYCLACETGFETHEYGCIPKCESNQCARWDQAKEEFICQKCPLANCKINKDDKNCILCNKGWYDHQGECVQTCPVGIDKIHEGSCKESCPKHHYFEPKVSVCQKCSDDCDECAGMYHCKSCKLGSFLYEGTCSKKCPIKTFINSHGKECLPCPDECGFCVLNSLEQRPQCINCDKGLLWTGDGCVNECPENIPFIYESSVDSFQCVRDCPANSFRNSTLKACLTCPNNCAHCKNSATCLICENQIHEYLLHNGKCVYMCPTGYHKAMGACEPCTNCKNCGREACFECDDGYVMFEEKCIKGGLDYLWIIIGVLSAVLALYIVVSINKRRNQYAKRFTNIKTVEETKEDYADEDSRPVR